MKFAQLSLLAALAMAAPHAALAQQPGSTTTTTTTSGDSGSVSNADSITSSTTSTDVTTDTGTSMMSDTAPAGEMANTGGAPELMALVGVLLACGGLLLRRKSASQAV